MTEPEPPKVVALTRPAAGSDAHGLSLEQVQAVFHEELAKATDEPFSALDAQAIDDEQTFIQRFGFDWPRQFRRDLVCMKHKLDLTDAEIRLLQKTGNFLLHNEGLRLNSNRRLAIYGWAQIAVLQVVFGAPLSYVILNMHLTWLQFGVWLIMAVAWLSLSRALFLFYVRPWRIQDRVQSRRAVPG